MRGIYPDYIGPTVEYRHASRLPRWIGVLGGVLVPPEGWLGGVEVLSNAPGVAIVAKAAATVVMATKTAVTQITKSLGYMMGPEVGADVTDEEPGTDE